MAIYHLSLRSVKAGTGASAIAHAAYISASLLESERTGLSSDYSKKGDVVHTELLLPDGISTTREQLWNDVEAAITIDKHCYGKTGDFALPLEWSDEESLEIARQFLTENFVSKGYAVDWAYHKKDGNPHIDFFVPSLKFSEEGTLVPAKMKSVFANSRDDEGRFIYDPELPSYDKNNPEETSQYRFPVIDPTTGEQKVRNRKGGKEKCWHRVDIENDGLTSREFLLQLRQSWQDIANAHLDADHQIDCRTLEAQGIDREPQIHLSPTVIAMEKKNPGSMEKVKRNNKIKERNSLKLRLKLFSQDIQSRINLLRHDFIQALRKTAQKPSQGLSEPQKGAWTPDKAKPKEQPKWLTEALKRQSKNKGKDQDFEK